MLEVKFTGKQSVQSNPEVMEVDAAKLNAGSNETCKDQTKEVNHLTFLSVMLCF